MRYWRLQSILFLALLTVPAIAQNSSEPVVAFAIGTTLTLVTSSGQVTQEIRLGHPVYDFAFSKDRKRLVIVAPETENGGNLSLFDLQTHAETRLTHGPFYKKHLEKGESEVYADPQFSPDGRSIAFAIHGNLPDEGNDAEEAVGPIAVVDLGSGKVRVLKSTENVDGQGPCDVGAPIWSPDGKWIIFNCDSGVFITDSAGMSLRPVKKDKKERLMASPITWVGNQCILYLQGSDGSPYDPKVVEEAGLLNLQTSEVQGTGILFTFPPDAVDGLAEASESALVRRKSWGSGYSSYVETKGSRWRFPSSVAVHALGGWSYSTIPQGCD
jgi:hypothetical protein